MNNGELKKLFKDVFVKSEEYKIERIKEALKILCELENKDEAYEIIGELGKALTQSKRWIESLKLEEIRKVEE